MSDPPPEGRRIGLPGRGTTFLRELAGPAGAPTALLIHGWAASGGLNWVHAFDRLARHFRVLAVDLRGHGRGIRSTRSFRLEHCADDIAAVLDRESAGPVIAVGYSMGGPVAQLLWRRHRQRVSGLVMCATSGAPIPGVATRRVFGSLMSAASGATRLASGETPPPRQTARPRRSPPTRRRPVTFSRWAVGEFTRHHWPTLLEAGRALARYDARSWLRDVDVPTAAVVTARDGAIAPNMQRDTARAIPGARIHEHDDGHLACTKPAFGRAIVHATREVAQRSRS